MVEIETSDADSIDLKVDASTYVLAGVFNAVAFPPGMPDYQKIAIMDKTAQVRDAAGDALIDSQMNADGEHARQEKEQADGNDTASLLIQIIQQEKAEREREEWEHTRSTVAGVTMTGEEWSNLAERLRSDEEFRRKLTEAFEKRGATREEAEARVDRVELVADAAATPPSQRTDDQKKILKQADSDISLRADVQSATAAMNANPVQSQNSDMNKSFTTAASGSTPTTRAPETMPTARPVVAMSGPGF